MFSCTYRHARWYAGTSLLAFTNKRDVTLAHFLLHLQTCRMLRWHVFSCTCKHTGCYAGTFRKNSQCFTDGCLSWESALKLTEAVNLNRSNIAALNSFARCEEKRSDVRVKLLERRKLISCGRDAKASCKDTHQWLAQPTVAHPRT